MMRSFRHALSFNTLPFSDYPFTKLQWFVTIHFILLLSQTRKYKMSEENLFAALSLFICNTWPSFQKKPLQRNEMMKAANDLDSRLREVCGALGSHVVDASCKLFDSKWDSFAMDCEEKQVKVVFLYICSHAKINEEGDLLSLWLKNDEMTGSHLMEKIEYLRGKIPKSKVIIFLECCHAGALLPKNVGFKSPKLHDEDEAFQFMSRKRDDGALIGYSLQQLPHHPAKAKVKEDESTGTVLFMSCKREETSTAGIFASSIVEVLENNKTEVTAETLVEEVSKSVWLKTRISTYFNKQSPIFYCREDVKKIGVIGGCGENMLTRIKPPDQSYHLLGNSNHLLQVCWSEVTFKTKSAEVKGLLEDLSTELSWELREISNKVLQELEADFKERSAKFENAIDVLTTEFPKEVRKPLDDVITMYENVESLERRIVFCGEPGCGKSTLINAMVGYDILACSGGPSGCTSTVIEMRENKNQNNFKAIVSIMERSDWNEEADRLRKTLTNEKCDVVEEVKELLEKIYGSSDVEGLPDDVERLFQQGGRIQIEKENHQDLKMELSCFVSNGWGKGKEYWPIVKKVEILIPNCDILQGGLVLVYIPEFVYSNPVRKDDVEKEYASADSVCVCARTLRSGANETFQKPVQDYIENLRGLKEVTFVLTKSDDSMKDSESYFKSLGNSEGDYEYLHDLHTEVEKNSDLFKNFEIECAKHWNSKSRAALERQLRKEDVENESCMREVHSVSGLDYLFWNKIRQGQTFFGTPDETGIPDLMNSLKRTDGNHVILLFKRFLLECQKLPGELENSSNTHLKNFEIECAKHWNQESHDIVEEKLFLEDLKIGDTQSNKSDLVKALEMNAVKLEQLCQRQFKEMIRVLDKALINDFQTARVNGICTDWSKKHHHMTLKAALVRRGQYTSRKNKNINLNADLLQNTVAVLKGKCAELVTKIKQHVSNFFEKELNVFVETGRDKHPERKTALLTIEESGKFLEDDLCESFDKLVQDLISRALWGMSTLLKSLYSQLVKQNDFGSEARRKFVQDALDDGETKEKLKMSINALIDKKELMCSDNLNAFIAVVHQQMASSLYDESAESEIGFSGSIQNFKKKLDVILEVKKERDHQEPSSALK